MNFLDELQRLVAQVERGINQHLPLPDAAPRRLHTAMRYSLEAGGKRLRPVLALATAEALGVSGDGALPAAVALECIHTYSLIHDDLPCMDNDDLRRGRPTAHKAFDEATALLAGDALLTHAFALLANAYADQPNLAHGLIRELATAAGSQRLIGGQMADLLAEKKANATSEELDFIHLNKTAAMIEASLVMGGLVGGAEPSQIATLRTAGRHLGLSFQIIDDILDVTATSDDLGKTAGKDARTGKTTYVTQHGLETARRFAAAHSTAARLEIARFPGSVGFLIALIESMAARTK
jgi:geranylgeranyl diphosphate synthase, type II